ncbi:MAG: 16S rRNA (cytosine(1402)-N(4))-methyltransferase RsmH [Firmicutes bacterium]|nr:16S rRNA (cytosine(1402)-N(4))-methyltransferase RsmH [Bacillota bacterium]
MEFNHEPVLLDEVINGLDLRPGMSIIDCTMGGGGHSLAMIEKILPNGSFIGIDQDMIAVETAQTRITNFLKGLRHGKGFQFYNENFKNIDKIFQTYKLRKVDAILADIGVSSYQIDTPERGLSYMVDGPLDMRMGIKSKKKAIHLVNELSEKQLAELIKNFGEEKYAKSIAKNIVTARPVANSTLALAKICVNSVPSSYYKTGGHPAKRTFQALRIAVNAELEALEEFIPRAIEVLQPKGRLAIISFHSLEDRIVKQVFKKLESNCLCPPKTPKCICGHKARVKIITKKPILPTNEEIQRNSRSASAKLRIVEKIV